MRLLRHLTIDWDVTGVHYRIEDERGRTSSTFRIAVAPGERATVTAHSPSAAVHDVGVTATTLGVIALVASL